MRHLRRYLFCALDGDGAPWGSPACVEWRGDTYGRTSETVTDVDCPACLVLLDAAIARGEVSVQKWEWPRHLWVHMVDADSLTSAVAVRREWVVSRVVEQRDVEAAS